MVALVSNRPPCPLPGPEYLSARPVNLFFGVVNSSEGRRSVRISCMFRWFIASVLLAGTAAAADVTDGRVTFNREVLPILEKNCQGCHRPGQIAPMSFLTYETTRPWARKIKVVVGAKKMPPAVTSPHYIVLTKDDGLSQAEIDTIVKWVDGGAIEGPAEAGRKKPAK